MLCFQRVLPKYLKHRISQGHNKYSFHHLSSTWLPLIGECDLEDLTTEELRSELAAR